MGNSLLRTSLTANAAFSLTSGCILAAFGGEAATLILAHASDWGPWVLRGLGVALVAFSLLLVGLARDRGVDLAKAAPIVISDLAWVGMSAALIVFAQGVLTDNGRLVVGLIAAVVALLASLQWYGGRLTVRLAA